MPKYLTQEEAYMKCEREGKFHLEKRENFDFPERPFARAARRAYAKKDLVNNPE